MEKQYKEKTIFSKQSDSPIPAREYLHLVLGDDIVVAGFDEGHYSENNSWDPHYYVSIKRQVLETDEEFERRKEREQRDKDYAKQRRFASYLKLKEEFEPSEE